MARNLLVDTAVEPLGDGRYRADVPGDWNAAVFIFGGVPITVAMRAAAAEIDARDYEVRSLDAVFCTPFTAGGMLAEVEVLRAGKAARQVSVDVTPEDAEQRPGMRMVATYGRDGEHPLAFTELAFPDDVPLPSQIEAPPARSEDAPIPVIRQLEHLPVLGQQLFRPTEPGPARTARWVRFREPVGADLPSLAVHADELGLAVMQKRRAGDPFSFVISLDISIHFVRPPESEWILLDSSATDAGRGYVSGIVNLWDAEQRLVAVATQRALLKAAPTEVVERLEREYGAD